MKEDPDRNFHLLDIWMMRVADCPLHGNGTYTSAMIDRPVIPADAGEWADGLASILRRIPDGWGRWIRVSRGWYPLVVALNEEIARLDGKYVVFQVKQKFGALRYYMASEATGSTGVTINSHVGAARARAERTCEICSAPAALSRSPSGWYRTLCPECTTASGSRPATT